MKHALISWLGLIIICLVLLGGVGNGLWNMQKDYGIPAKLILEDRWDDISDPGDPLFGHGQGAAYESPYLWYSKDNYLARTYSAHPDWANPLATNSRANIEGNEVVEINGIHVYGDYVYTTGITGITKDGYRCWVKWYDKMTLEYVDERELFWDGDDGVQEGITFYGGYWWATLWKGQISQFDSDWRFVANHSLPGIKIAILPKWVGQIQGHDWFNGQLWVGTTRGPMRIYNWNGKDKFTLSSILLYPPELTYGQSFSISQDGSFLYIADFADATNRDSRESVDNLFKYSIVWSGKDGTTVNYWVERSLYPVMWFASEVGYLATRNIISSLIVLSIVLVYFKMRRKRNG